MRHSAKEKMMVKEVGINIFKNDEKKKKKHSSKKDLSLFPPLSFSLPERNK